MKLCEIQKQIKSSPMNGEQIYISIISNITFEPYFNLFIKNLFAQNDTLVNILPIGIEEYQSEESQGKIYKANYIIIYIDFNYLFPNASNDIILNKLTFDVLLDSTKNKCKELYKFIKQRTQSPIFWFGFEDYCYEYNYVNGNVLVNQNLINKTNEELCILLEKQDIYIDFKRLIANIGIKNAYDNKGKRRWNAPYTQELIVQMCNEIYKQYLIKRGVTKKCIVLDCDNVIWGGILSENGIENIKLGGSGLGRSYQDFQRYLLTLYYHGVILTVCSKNDLSDVMLMFREHSEMILKEEFISSFQVNWENKPENIKKIAKVLNIGLDSMVFIDDSDFEIQSVKLLLPEVAAIKYEYDTIYERLSCFNLKNNVDLEKVKHRNDTYKTNEQRELLKAEYQSFDEYLRGLEMKIDIHESLPIEFNRIAELTQRTNKCTNGKRYTVEQLKDKLKNDKYKLYSVFLVDRFSDLGLVGVIGIDNKILDLFSLSCRALGRNIEEEMLEHISSIYIHHFWFISTGKNDELRTKLKYYIKGQ